MDDQPPWEMLAAIRQYFHRLVVCMDSEVLPHVAPVSYVLLQHTNVRNLLDYIPLIAQVIAKFKVRLKACTVLYCMFGCLQRTCGNVVHFLNAVVVAIPERSGSVPQSRLPHSGVNFFSAMERPLAENDEAERRERTFIQKQYYQLLSIVGY